MNDKRIYYFYLYYKKTRYKKKSLLEIGQLKNDSEDEKKIL